MNSAGNYWWLLPISVSLPSLKLLIFFLPLFFISSHLICYVLFFFPLQSFLFHSFSSQFLFLFPSFKCNQIKDLWRDLLRKKKRCRKHLLDLRMGITYSFFPLYKSLHKSFIHIPPESGDNYTSYTFITYLTVL